MISWPLHFIVEQLWISEDKLKFVLTNNIAIKIPITIKFIEYSPVVYFKHHYLY
jgi:hypothetical protein